MMELHRLLFVSHKVGLSDAVEYFTVNNVQLFGING